MPCNELKSIMPTIEEIAQTKQAEEQPINVGVDYQWSSGVSRGDDDATAPRPLGLTVNFWDKFCTVFVSFVSRLNCKIRVQ